MKNIFRCLKIYCFTIGLVITPLQLCLAQTVLAPGDLAIIGVNTDTPDDFAFLLMRDIEENTEILFTDKGWNFDSTFRTTEGVATFTTSGNIPGGTVINLSDSNYFEYNNNKFSLAQEGDQVIAFQGSLSSPSFIYAINFDGEATWQDSAYDSHTSTLPLDLENGVTAVAVIQAQNVKYSGSATFSSPGEALASIGDYNNWVGSSTPYDLTVFGDFSLPVELVSFTATSLPGEILLEWVTESEFNNLGFLIYRRSASSPATLLADYRTAATLKGQGSTARRTKYSFTDKSVRPDETYLYQLSDISFAGAIRANGWITATPQKPVVKLFSAWPNPFNPQTNIVIFLPAPTHCRLAIYGISGRLITVIYDDRLEAGKHSFAWGGLDDAGREAASGVYILTLQAGGSAVTKKLILTR